MFKKSIEVRKLSENNIIQVGSKRHTAELIEQFYTKNAFPNYEDFDTVYDVENTLKDQEPYLIPTVFLRINHNIKLAIKTNAPITPTPCSWVSILTSGLKTPTARVPQMPATR